MRLRSSGRRPKGIYPMYAYCLFCETQRCALIARLIERSTGIRCIFPEIIQRMWVKGKCEEKRHSWLPGYLFLYTDEPISEPIRIAGIIRMLGKGELQNEDLAFAKMLYDCNGIMGTISLTEVGDRCIITDPVWQKIEGKVIKIDRGRKRCCIEFTFDQIRRTVWLGYELIQSKTEKKEITQPT